MIDGGEKLFYGDGGGVNFDGSNLGGSWSTVSQSERAPVKHLTDGARERKKGGNKGDLSHPSAHRHGSSVPSVGGRCNCTGNLLPPSPKLP